jgi:two-component system OmpR family sensor kinase
MSGTRAPRPWSLSHRLVAALTLSLGALWLAAAAIATGIALHQTNQLFDSALQESAQRLLSLAGDDVVEHDKETERAIGDATTFRRHEEYLLYQIRGSDGRVLLRSHDAPAEPFPTPLTPGFAEAGGLRFYTEVSADGRLTIQIAEARSHRTKALLAGFFSLIAPLPLLLPLAALIILGAVRRALRPIGTVREAIAARGGANLDAIPESGLPAELAPIVRDVNRLLDRLGATLEAERAFAANSAHEMRTPVAAALAQIQRLGAELAGTPHRDRVQQVETTLRRLASRVAKLLQLARADSGLAVTGESADLLPVLQLVFDDYQRSPEAAERLAFAPPTFARLPARIDIDAFAIAFRNLLENALAHGDRGQPVRIWVEPDRSIHIANAGAVVPRDVLERLTQRFVRGPSAAEGSGLGLAIAEKILHQAGGALALHSPATGQADGFEAVVRLPPSDGAAI